MEEIEKISIVFDLEHEMQYGLTNNWNVPSLTTSNMLFLVEKINELVKEVNKLKEAKGEL